MFRSARPFRSATAGAFLCALATAASAQFRDNPCSDGWNSDRASHCEVREATIGGANPLDIDAGRNGGIRVRGWDRGDVLVRSIIRTSADTDADARRIASAVRIDTSGTSVHAEGPSLSGDEHWSVSFELQVPRTAMLSLTTQNGGISIADFQGTAKFTAQNGGVSLINVGGDLRGETTNGGVTIDLRGDHWNGAGLDVETRNGGIRMTMPANYSAQLETGTTNGRINVDFPITVQGSLGRSLTTTLGAGGARIRAITTNGGVTIRRQ
jgi:Putative adhesin